MSDFYQGSIRTLMEAIYEYIKSDEEHPDIKKEEENSEIVE